MFILFAVLFASLITWQFSAYYHRKYKYLAYHDSLTDLPNRHFFNQVMPVILARAKRECACFAIMMIDIDNFKTINDHFGHQAGDACLQTVAQSFKLVLRKMDILMRFGGDEFMLILEEVSDFSAIDSVKKKLIDSVIQPVGISVGVAVYPQHGETISELLHHADSSLYQNKNP